jgi:hypothetical protein
MAHLGDSQHAAYGAGAGPVNSLDFDTAPARLYHLAFVDPTEFKPENNR